MERMLGKSFCVKKKSGGFFLFLFLSLFYLHANSFDLYQNTKELPLFVWNAVDSTLDSDNQEKLLSAFQLLGKQKDWPADKNFSEKLLPFLSNENEDILISAIRAFAKQRKITNEISEKFVELLNTENIKIQIKILKIFAKVKELTPEANHKIISLLETNEQSLKIQIIKTIKHHPSLLLQNLDKLLILANEQDQKIQIETYLVFGALKYWSSKVNMQIENGLKSSKKPINIVTLKTIAKQKNWTARIQAAHFLLLKKENIEIQVHALKALHKQKNWSDSIWQQINILYSQENLDKNLESSLIKAIATRKQYPDSFLELVEKDPKRAPLQIFANFKILEPFVWEKILNSLQQLSNSLDSFENLDSVDKKAQLFPFALLKKQKIWPAKYQISNTLLSFLSEVEDEDILISTINAFMKQRRIEDTISEKFLELLEEEYENKKLKITILKVFAKCKKLRPEESEKVISLFLEEEEESLTLQAMKTMQKHPALITQVLSQIIILANDDNNTKLQAQAYLLFAYLKKWSLSVSQQIQIGLESPNKKINIATLRSLAKQKKWVSSREEAELLENIAEAHLTLLKAKDTKIQIYAFKALGKQNSWIEGVWEYIISIYPNIDNLDTKLVKSINNALKTRNGVFPPAFIQILIGSDK